jgi:putative oxidoreductase
VDGYSLTYRSLKLSTRRYGPWQAAEQRGPARRWRVIRMSNIVRIARFLLGIIFVIFGLNGFYTFIPVPSFHPFMQILVSSGYIYLIKTVEILAGSLLLANRAVVLSMILLGADIANIVTYHLLLDHRNWPIGPVVSILYAIVVWGYWQQLKVLFRWKI